MTNASTLPAPRREWKSNARNDFISENSEKEKKERFDNALKVYIKNLPLDDKPSFNALMEHISSCGTVQHEHFFVKTLASQKIQQVLIVFSSEDEAVQATKLTGTLIGGRHIIVSRFRQYSQPTLKTIFVSNLAVETNEEDLWEFFENCGVIKFIHIDRPLNACSLRGEVHFKSEKGALQASKLNGNFLKGNAIVVSSSSENRESQRSTNKEFPVFVAGLPHDIQKEDLIQFFDGCGPIKRIKIKSLQEEGEGQAVVFFMDSESAENAIACNGNEISGFVLSVSQREEGMLQYEFLNPVFVAGISRDTKDVDIFLKFQDCGLIHDVKFVQSKCGSLKKCVIEFKDGESMEKALNMTNLELKGHNLIIGRSREIWSTTNLVMKPKKRKLKKIEEHEVPSVAVLRESGEKKKKKVKKNL